ncbi:MULTISPECIES: DUF1353 domain-containing protein [unclassified Brevundimonas]|uniref:DUF1353 domain-containing protein n=1 Tax=unclassified Brevundimonas TaxID=2622653 RepID=UPI0014302D6E|nr:MULTISPECIES: DUF1353 domain-containing protein [unclassified Brevundimonas]
MSRFTEARYELTGKMRNGRPEVCLTTPLAYEIGYLGSGWVVEAPEGFCTDLASLPVWTQRLRWGRRLARKLARASIVHDLLRSDRRVPKLKADVIFLEAMAVDGVRLSWRVIAFITVLLNFSRD